MFFYIANVVQWIFNVYIMFLMVRIIGSWFPSFAHHKLMRFVAFYTDPYLNWFRRIIPPIKGVLDISPILAFFALNLIENFLLYLLGHFA